METPKQQDFLSDLVHANVRVDSYGDGEMMMSQRLTLEMLDAESAQIKGQKEQKTKNIQKKEKIEKIDKKEDKIVEALGEPYHARRSTKAVSRVTIYGKEQEFIINGRENSLFGLNVELINTQGDLNAAVFGKYLRGIVPSHELKEQRLNRLFNSLVTKDFYENYTVVGIILNQMILLREFFDKNSRYKGYIWLTLEERNLISSKREEEAVEEFQRLIKNKGTFGFKGTDAIWYDMVADLKSARPVPEDEQEQAKTPELIELFERRFSLANEKQKKVLNKERRELAGMYPVPYTYWKMFDYDDGHSQMGANSGKVFEFIDGKFLVPLKLFEWGGEQLTTETKAFNYPTDDNAIDAWASIKYFVNLSGFTSKEYAIIDKVFSGTKRMTPFMIDQTINTGIDSGQVKCFHAPDFDEGTYDITVNDLVSVYRKFAGNHRCYEDFLAARNTLIWHTAQPGADTLESYFWFGIRRVQDLPSIGMRRACMPFTLEGDGACITTEALNEYSRVVAGILTLPSLSAYCNTAWYWGEYMLVYNHADTAGILAHVHKLKVLDINLRDRCVALASAILGCKVPVTPFVTMGLYMKYTIEEELDRAVLGDNIMIPYPEDYSYSISPDRKEVNFGQIVCPGALAMIVGLNGELIRDTPYSAYFTTETACKHQFKTQIKRSLNYNDLWAISVIQRWQGYDVHYKPIRSNNIHKSFAANGVQVSLPPVGLKNVDEVDLYQFVKFEERQNSFGTEYPPTLNTKTYMTWRRSVAVALISPQFKQPECNSTIGLDAGITKFKLADSVVRTYRAYILGNYDISKSNFQYEVVMAGQTNLDQHAPAPHEESESQV